VIFGLMGKIGRIQVDDMEDEIELMKTRDLQDAR
jgi:hypothetical protein